MCVYIYMYIYMCMYIYTYMYVLYGAIKYLSHFKAYEVGNKRLNISGRATIRKRMGTGAIKYCYHQTGVYFSRV